MRLETTTLMFLWAKTVHVLDRAATLIGKVGTISWGKSASVLHDLWQGNFSNYLQITEGKASVQIYMGCCNSFEQQQQNVEHINLKRSRRN